MPNVAAKGALCRRAEDICDVEEYCDGVRETCPNDERSCAFEDNDGDDFATTLGVTRPVVAPSRASTLIVGAGAVGLLGVLLLLQ